MLWCCGMIHSNLKTLTCLHSYDCSNWYLNTTLVHSFLCMVSHQERRFFFFFFFFLHKIWFHTMISIEISYVFKLVMAITVTYITFDIWLVYRLLFVTIVIIAMAFCFPSRISSMILLWFLEHFSILPSPFPTTRTFGINYWFQHLFFFIFARQFFAHELAKVHQCPYYSIKQTTTLNFGVIDQRIFSTMVMSSIFSPWICILLTVAIILDR